MSDLADRRRQIERANQLARRALAEYISHVSAKGDCSLPKQVRRLKLAEDLANKFEDVEALLNRLARTE